MNIVSLQLRGLSALSQAYIGNMSRLTSIGFEGCQGGPSMQYLSLSNCTKLKELRLVAVGDPEYDPLSIGIESMGALRRVHLELTGIYIPFHIAP